MVNKGLKPKYKKILLGLFIVLLAGAGVVWYIFTEKFTDTANRKSDFTVNAMDFIKEFRQNASMANRKYTERSSW